MRKTGITWHRRGGASETVLRQRIRSRKVHDMKPWWRIAARCVTEDLRFQSVHWAAGSTCASALACRRRLEYLTRAGYQRGAGGLCGGQAKTTRNRPTIAGMQPKQRCLTLRSKGAPTACHQARAGGTLYIFTSPGLASHRWRPLSSHVRQHKAAAANVRKAAAAAQYEFSTAARPPAKRQTN